MIEHQYQKEEFAKLQIEKLEQEKLHQSVIENSLDGTLIINSDFIVLYANEETSSITGYDLESIVASDIRKIFSDKERSKISTKITTLFDTGGKDVRFEFTISGPLGIPRNIYASSSIIEDFKGQRANVLQILDITEIKQAEERTRKINIDLEERVNRRTKELQETLSELESEVAERKKTERQLKNAQIELESSLNQEKELNTLKTRFISMISHEYRTPLTVILTSTYLIEQFYKGPNMEQFKKFLAKIRGSVKSMTQLLEDVLTIGQSESGKLNINPAKLPLSLLIKDLFEEAKIMDKGSHAFVLDDGGQKHEIISDEKLLRHIFSNLILNAAKYSPNADTVKVTITKGGTDHVVISVIDYGIGIPASDIGQIFEAFYRSENVGTISGTGLGLAIVMRSIRSLKGEISVKSEVNEGTTFTLRLPLVIEKPKQMIIKNEKDLEQLEEMKKKSFANL